MKCEDLNQTAEVKSQGFCKPHATNSAMIHRHIAQDLAGMCLGLVDFIKTCNEITKFHISSFASQETMEAEAGRWI